MGDVLVPIAAKWRAQTQRAVENFPISGATLEPAHIVAMDWEMDERIKAIEPPDSAANNTHSLDLPLLLDRTMNTLQPLKNALTESR